MRLLQELGGRSPRAGARPGVALASCHGRRCELADRDLLDVANRELEKALAERAELLRRARREKAAAACRAGSFSIPLAGQRLGDLAGGLLRREARVASREDPLGTRVESAGSG